jgi:hypothetical protein
VFEVEGADVGFDSHDGYRVTFFVTFGGKRNSGHGEAEVEGRDSRLRNSRRTNCRVHEPSHPATANAANGEPSRSGAKFFACWIDRSI